MKLLQELLSNKDETNLTSAIAICEKVQRRMRVHGWTQYAPARDKHGGIVSPDHPSADVWSVYGAMRLFSETIEEYDTLSQAIMLAATRRLRRKIPIRVGLWNDGFCGNIMDVSRVLEDAIAILTRCIDDKQPDVILEEEQSA